MKKRYWLGAVCLCAGLSVKAEPVALSDIPVEDSAGKKLNLMSEVRNMHWVLVIVDGPATDSSAVLDDLEKLPHNDNAYSRLKVVFPRSGFDAAGVAKRYPNLSNHGYYVIADRTADLLFEFPAYPALAGFTPTGTIAWRHVGAVTPPQRFQSLLRDWTSRKSGGQ